MMEVGVLGQKRKSSEVEGGINGPAQLKKKETEPSDQVPIALRGHFSSRKGEREEMQDSHVILEDFSRELSATVVLCPAIKRMSYYAVFDGHNGSRAAHYAAANLHKNLASKLRTGPDLETVESTLKRSLVESYKQTDEVFLSEATKVKPVWKDGTTATTVLAINNSLFIANLGDSKAILCRWKAAENKEVALTLTKDHSPQMFEERMRIQKAGGSVKDGRILGMLEVSRSIGDGQYKNHGVSCLPDIKKCILTDQDRYLLIACDGLWKTFSNQDVLSFVAENLKKLRTNEEVVATEEKCREQVIWEAVSSQLAAEAVKRGSGDNVTVVLVSVGNC